MLTCSRDRELQKERCHVHSLHILQARTNEPRALLLCPVVPAMDAVAMAALAVIVDHDHDRVLEHLLQENVALREQLQELQQLRLKLRRQAIEMFELRNTVVDQSLRIARLLNTTCHARFDDEQ